MMSGINQHVKKAISIEALTSMVVNFYTQLLPFVIGLTITFVAAFLLNRILTKRLEKQVAAKSKKLLTGYTFFRRLLVLAVILLGTVFTVFTVFPGLENLVSSLIITAGFTSVVIGLAAQQSLSNLIAGFLASTSRPVDIGDAVVFGEDFCFVEDITLMQTILKTWDNRRLIVPNSTLFSEVITNYTKTDPTMLAPMFVTITYESNLDRAIEILLDEAKNHPDCQPIGDLPSVVVMDYTERGIKLRLLSRAKDQPTAFMMIRDLLYSVKKRFDAEGVAIAPPRTYITFDQQTRKDIIDLAREILKEKPKRN
jgi:small-conductance mechanosensitive channel